MNEAQPLQPLVAQLIQQQIRDSQDTTNRLVDSLQSQVNETRATLDAVRYEVRRLLIGDYMPTPDVLIRALYPRQETVNQFRHEGTEA